MREQRQVTIDLAIVGGVYTGNHSLNTVFAFSVVTPRNKNTLLRDNSPLINSTAFLDKPKLSARKAIKAKLARPSIGGA